MRVLLIGAGGREHALACALSRSPRLDKLFVAPGNGGTASLAETAAFDVADHDAVIAFCRAERIDLVVIGPEAPLVAGLVDALEAAGIAAFGPSQAAARLEGSKAFTKALCDEAGIPTARYARFTEEAPALAYLRQEGAPIVVKADGLAAGKGVTVATSLKEAEEAVRACFAGAFGEAGATVVIEEMLEGEEASLFVVSDGNAILPLPAAQDHKRAFDGDAGPNTGGMGAYAPAPVMTPSLTRQALSEIVEPAIAAMAARGTPFKGVLFAGLMITPEGPKLIEFNTRFGDPEAQALLMLLDTDLLDILEAAAAGRLAGLATRWKPGFALTVVLAARGYPGPYEKGTPISGLEGLDADDLRIFHAGTRLEGGRLLADGGRVLAVTAHGATLSAARERAYGAIARIDWPEGFWRTDIGWRALGPGRR